MSKNPAFLFYPGDYLRDTQCLSESVQVAYDRIMCEHMRNICISQSQLKFFTKRLNDLEISELLSVLTETDGGFQITWVAESIIKYRAYSDSRRKNRGKKDSEHMSNISKTYVAHMENEIVNEDLNGLRDRKGGMGENPYSPTFKQVEVYFSLKELGESDARRFFDHYEAVGWFVNGQPIRKWQPKADQWIRDDNGFSAKAKKQKAESGSSRSKLAEMKKNVDQGGNNFLNKLTPNEQTVPSLEIQTVYK